MKPMVRTIILAALLLAFAAPARAAPYEDGLAARTAYEAWFASIGAPEQEGAAYWAAQRSERVPGTCARRTHTEADRRMEAGCREAQARLAPADRRRLREPAYRIGWNAYREAPPAVAEIPEVSEISIPEVAQEPVVARLVSLPPIQPVAATFHTETPRAADQDSTAATVVFGFVALCLFVYFAPTLLANGRKSASAHTIFVINLLLGWTFIAWFFCLCWAAFGQTRAQQAFFEKFSR